LYKVELDFKVVEEPIYGKIILISND